VLPFQDAARTPEGDWRHIVRFGRNVASYKFALGQALLDLGAQQQTFVRLEDLAVPYAAAICEHLQVEDRQSTSAQSQFLDACRSHNRGELDAGQLAETTVRLGFANVVDAFHISRGGESTQTRFFVDERASRQGITLTDHLLELANGLQATVLPREVDARWNLVQMSWGLRLGTRLVSFEMTPDDDAVDLYAPARLRRGPITGVRDALSGYQDGRCAYCLGPFTDIGTSRVAVDHVLPFVLMSRGWQDGDLHQVWNLVLACYACNSAKRDRPPAADWMPWLDQRGEDLIASHHPLRDTLLSQLGPDPASRHQTLARRYAAAIEMMRSSWKPPVSTVGR
jgi:5-methylcytosine-specific restriction endonuclease McrA